MPHLWGRDGRECLCPIQQSGVPGLQHADPCAHRVQPLYLRKQIGEGGMSRVFLALDRTLNREVALKILNSDLSKDSERISQFEREARITASISHPNVVKVFSVGNDQGHFFIAMELSPSAAWTR